MLRSWKLNAVALNVSAMALSCFAIPMAAAEDATTSDATVAARVNRTIPNASTLVSLQFELPTASDIVPAPASDASIKLRGRDARYQLLVSARDAHGSWIDVTHRVRFDSENPSVAILGEGAVLIPVDNGKVKIHAHLPDPTGPSILSASVAVDITGCGSEPAVSFVNQVVPIFTKLSCNSGGCHGKAAGQNGFRLSLLGFEPQDDYEFLVSESRGRRLFPAAPDQSLLLTKAINQTPHGGGQRLEKDSQEYRILRRWISQGSPRGSDQDPRVFKIAITPSSRRMQKNQDQQLSVIATYSDGSTEDITRTALYESNNTDIITVNETGLATSGKFAGDAAIMARYQGKVAVYQATVPLGTAENEYPEPRNVVDRHVFAKLKSLGIPTSKRSTDEEFLRRVTLDIAGRIPSLDETTSFLSDTSETKRDVLIDRLLESTDYADHFAKKWSSILRNRRPNAAFQYGSYALHDWLRTSFYQNKSYESIVRELVTATGSIEANPPVAWYREVNNTESRVEDFAQLFLGQRMQCARCHHHPFEKWGQSDYYQLAAFFSQVAKKEGSTAEQPIFIAKAIAPSATNSKSGQSVPPAGLDSPPCLVPANEDARQHLMEWMVRPENPFFAKSIVNRYWKHMLGRGLVEPEDDMRSSNPPTNPELLDALAAFFIESDFDLKKLLRLIAQSHVYQFTSDANELNLQDQSSYSRYYPKRLTAEMMLDSIDLIGGTQTAFDGMPMGTKAMSLPDSSFSSYFLTVFGRPDSSTACECERTQESNLAQSLHLLNSKEVQNKLSDDSGTAARLAADSTRDHTKKIEELYLVAYSRRPTDKELQTAIAYLERKGDKKREAYEDLIWAIVNSKEFGFNH